MADHTGIEWADSTFNPWIGCTKISPACDHCYAAVSSPARALGVEWGAGQPRRRTSAAYWKQPLRWNRADFQACGDCGWRGEIDTLEDDTCPACGKHERLEPARRRVFCASLADVFDNEVDPTWRRDLFALIAATPNLDWLLLTKRIGNAHDMIRDALARIDPLMQVNNPWPWRNVWIGATIANQQEAIRDVPKLHATPAAIRFLSMEPLLGPVDLWPHLDIEKVPSDGGVLYEGGGRTHGIDWVIVGGESGPHARPMQPDWVRDLRLQCSRAGVRFLFKQWGEWGPIYQPLIGTMGGELVGFAISGDMPMLPDPQDPHGGLIRCGKKRAGRKLDGRYHTEFPSRLQP